VSCPRNSISVVSPELPGTPRNSSPIGAEGPCRAHRGQPNRRVAAGGRIL